MTTETMLKSVALTLALAAVDKSTFLLRGDVGEAQFRHAEIISEGQLDGDAVRFRVGLNLAEFDPMATRYDYDAYTEVRVEASDGGRAVVMMSSGAMMPSSFYLSMGEQPWMRAQA